MMASAAMLGSGLPRNSLRTGPPRQLFVTRQSSSRNFCISRRSFLSAGRCPASLSGATASGNAPHSASAAATCPRRVLASNGPAPRSGRNDLQHNDAAVEIDGEHVARFDRVGGLSGLLAIDTDAAGLNELGRQRPRLHDAREEQPFVDALAPVAGHLLLQLVSQRGELGERRIRIDAHRPVFTRLLCGPRLGAAPAAAVAFGAAVPAVGATLAAASILAVLL